MNSIEKLMIPVMMAMFFNDLYRKRSRQVTSVCYLKIYRADNVFSTSTKSKVGFLLNLAILLNDQRNTVIFQRSVNSGVSSINFSKSRAAIRLGINIVKARVYFQFSIKQEKSDISEIPKENASWTAIIILYLVLPAMSSLKKLQWMLMAPFEPKPSKMAPIPTIHRFTEKMVKIWPAMQINQERDSPFLRPQLSAIWDIIIQPRRDPRQQTDWRREDTQALEQTIITPQSKAIEFLTGFLKCQYQKSQFSTLQTYYSQVSKPSYPSGQPKSGTQQKKLREKMIMAATTHLSAKTEKRRYWYLFQLPTRFSRDQTLFYYYSCSISPVLLIDIINAINICQRSTFRYIPFFYILKSIQSKINFKL